MSKWNDIEKEIIAWDFGVSVAEITQVVDFCCKITLLHVEWDHITCIWLKERLKDLIEKRDRERGRDKPKDEKGKFVSATETHSNDTVMPQSKVKESKVNNNILPNGNTTIVEAEKKEYTPTHQTQEINDMIEKVKNACMDAWVVYAPDPKERQYAKHLLSKKFDRDAIAPLKTDIDYFVRNVIAASAKRKYMKQIYNCQTLYYNWGSVINRIMLEKQEKSQKTETSF